MVWWVILAAAVAPAQQPADPQPLQALTQGCRALKADADRLRCYDREALAADRAIASGSIVVVSHAQVEKDHRAAFGYSEPSVRAAKAAHMPPVTEIKSVSSTVRTVSAAGYGRYNLLLADGSVWQNVDLLPSAPSPKEKVDISRTPFGSYLMKLPLSPSVHAKRMH